MKVQFKNSNEEFFKLATSAASQYGATIGDREQEFHDFIREILVCIFIYGFLYVIAYFVIKALRKSKETDEYLIDYEDAIADRIRIWLCTFTLATCFGAVLLLPMSIIASEVIRIAPNSFYWKWLNSSLLHGMWNAIFLFSNLSLFIFLPFAHLFFDSVGLPGYTKGIKSRIMETSLLLFIIAVAILGISFVISAIFDADNVKRQFFNLSDYHLPFIYSCISFFGVLILLICTPLGFARLFTIVSNLILRSPFRVDLKDEMDTADLQRQSIMRKIEDLEYRKAESNAYEANQSLINFRKELEQVTILIKQLEKQSKKSTLYRNLCYPFIMAILLLLNAFGVLIVAKNTLYVIFGQLPTSKTSSEYSIKSTFKSVILQNAETSTILYSLGILEISFEIILILYFMLASLVGFYTIPLFQKILPMYKSTPTDKIIINCAIFLIFSSALPVSSKILGLTRFDLLGHFGDLNWLSNVNIILIYNFSFAVATGISLFTKFTSKLRTELYSRILILFQSSRKVN